MANPELRDAVQIVTNELQGLRSALSFNNSSQSIKTFDGSQANLRNWLNEVEKFAYINRIDDNATKLIAYQSAGGKCSEFLQRIFQEYPRDNCEEIKEQLIARFGETTDPRQSFFILRHRRQKPDETIQAFSDELFTLSRKAYPNLRGHEVFIETGLVEIFIDGLRSPELQLKLLRDNPRTLMDAVKIALAEHDVLKRLELRRGRASSEKQYEFNRPARRMNKPPPVIDKRMPELMEVDHLRSQKQCYSCGKFGHLARHCRGQERVGPHSQMHYPENRRNYGNSRYTAGRQQEFDARRFAHQGN